MDQGFREGDVEWVMVKRSWRAHGEIVKSERGTLEMGRGSLSDNSFHLSSIFFQSPRRFFSRIFGHGSGGSRDIQALNLGSLTCVNQLFGTIPKAICM